MQKPSSSSQGNAPWQQQPCLPCWAREQGPPLQMGPLQALPPRWLVAVQQAWPPWQALLGHLLAKHLQDTSHQFLASHIDSACDGRHHFQMDKVLGAVISINQQLKSSMRGSTRLWGGSALQLLELLLLCLEALVLTLALRMSSQLPQHHSAWPAPPRRPLWLAASAPTFHPGLGPRSQPAAPCLTALQLHRLPLVVASTRSPLPSQTPHCLTANSCSTRHETQNCCLCSCK